MTCRRCTVEPAVTGRLFCETCEQTILRLAESATTTGHPDIPGGGDVKWTPPDDWNP